MSEDLAITLKIVGGVIIILFALPVLAYIAVGAAVAGFGYFVYVVVVEFNQEERNKK